MKEIVLLSWFALMGVYNATMHEARYALSGEPVQAQVFQVQYPDRIRNELLLPDQPGLMKDAIAVVGDAPYQVVVDENNSLSLVVFKPSKFSELYAGLSDLSRNSDAGLHLMNELHQIINFDICNWPYSHMPRMRGHEYKRSIEVTSHPASREVLALIARIVEYCTPSMFEGYTCEFDLNVPMNYPGSVQHNVKFTLRPNAA